MKINYFIPLHPHLCSYSEPKPFFFFFFLIKLGDLVSAACHHDFLILLRAEVRYFSTEELLTATNESGITSTTGRRRYKREVELEKQYPLE